jgi:type IV secretory pathway VirB10-like protein
MRAFLTVLLVSGMAWGQADTAKPAPASGQSAAEAGAAQDTHFSQNQGEAGHPSATAPAADPKAAVIPAGSKIPLVLKQAISTKNAREGDAVYAETAFPFVMNNRILVPAGTYVQGKIEHTERAGRSKKRAEILIHFTSMIYPSGYTVMLPGSIENTPGADDKGVKDSEGTIRQDKDTGKRIEDAAKGAAVGGTVGSIGGAAAGGWNGARYGGLAGIAGGVAWALLKHGPELKLDVGTSIEMEIERDVPVDASRIQVAKAAQ